MSTQRAPLASRPCLADLQPVNIDSGPAIRDDIDLAQSTCPPWSDRFHADCTVPVPSVRPVCEVGVCVEGPPDGARCDFEDEGEDDLEGAVCRGSDE